MSNAAAGSCVRVEPVARWLYSCGVMVVTGVFLREV